MNKGEKMTKRISVLMGAYNVEDTVGRAVESIIRQTNQEWCLLVCDDGSTDKTYAILEEYERKYPQLIKVYRNKQNKGLTYTLNRLIQKVNTEFIARMDADDISEKTRLDKEITFLDSHQDIALVGSSIYKFDEEGIFSTLILKKIPMKTDLYWNSPFVHPSIMIRTEVIKALQGYRDIEMTRRCEDYDLWFRLYSKGYQGYNLQEPLLYYYEGRKAYSKRKYKYRINEAKVRWNGYKINGLLPLGIIFVIKPLIVGLIPNHRFYKKSWRVK